MTTEQLNEIIKLLREAEEILQESNDKAEQKEATRLQPVGERRSL